MEEGRRGRGTHAHTRAPKRSSLPRRPLTRLYQDVVTQSGEGGAESGDPFFGSRIHRCPSSTSRVEIRNLEKVGVGRLGGRGGG